MAPAYRMEHVRPLIAMSTAYLLLRLDRCRDRMRQYPLMFGLPVEVIERERQMIRETQIALAMRGVET